ncbi:MAG: LysM peptidoglycan-binding domain-containing protein [Anaerolineaceae bacterium]|nr:LysM peptidoglycan-binding domain-containing protein [Anaerolineaceae bacterium]
MKQKIHLAFVAMAALTLLSAFFGQPGPVFANQMPAPLADEVSPYDLIAMMNALRVGNGLAELIEDPIINAVAQATAQIMADTNATWHIGNPSGRIQDAGYGGGGQVYATENFAMGGHQTIDNIMIIWSDFDHMRPATGPYCNVGAGVATSSGGVTYYVLQAAYVAGKSCGSYTSGGSTNPVTGSTVDKNTGVSLIVPVTVASPDAEGNLIHEVKYGQTLWGIAVAYKTTVAEIRIWNNLSENYKLQVRDKLVIPWPGAKGYKTPTPVGMILTSTPDSEGNITHIVQAYQTLSTISQAYGVSVENLLYLNKINITTPLEIGQHLAIRAKEVTPTPTQRPLMPIEKLTLALDGRYYHTVQEGQNLYRIAELYNISFEQLLEWNPSFANGGLMPGDQLLLHVTPPPTATFTPEPPTLTPIPPTSTSSATSSPTMVHTLTAKISATAAPSPSPTATPTKTAPFTVGGVNFLWFLPVLAVVIGGIELGSRKKRHQ